MEMREGLLRRWLVADGATVTKGEPIYEIETDKVESEIGAPEDGVLRWAATEGEVYGVGALLGHLEP